jgi:hypothetical protein
MHRANLLTLDHAWDENQAAQKMWQAGWDVFPPPFSKRINEP